MTGLAQVDAEGKPAGRQQPLWSLSCYVMDEHRNCYGVRVGVTKSGLILRYTCPCKCHEDGE